MWLVLSALGIGAAGGMKGAVEGLKFGKALGQNLTSLGGFASGGVTSEGGLAMVGERGKELMALPQGSRVMSNADMRSAVASNSGTRIIVDDIIIQGEDLRIVLGEANRKARNTT